MLQINNIEVADPSVYQVIISDIDVNSNRNAEGKLLRDRIATKRKLPLEWGPLSQSEICTLLTAVQDEFFEVTFIDPMEGVTSRTMYVGDRTAPAYCYDSTSGGMRWKNLKMDFIEQ